MPYPKTATRSPLGRVRPEICDLNRRLRIAERATAASEQPRHRSEEHIEPLRLRANRYRATRDPLCPARDHELETTIARIDGAARQLSTT